MLLAIPVVLMIYNISNTTQDILINIMLLGAFIEVFKSLQCMNMMGILRGGGDVKFAALNDIIFLWFFSLPMGYLCAFVWGVPFPIVFMMIKSDQIIKYITSSYRIHRNQWMNYIEEGEKNVSKSAN